MHKKEICALLFKGQNVMAFNFRGHGESEGVPSVAGTHLDAEAVYQYVKAKTGQDDNSIVLLPLCYSGGPVSSVAKNHPDVNIFLNQTYADFKLLFQDKASQAIQDYIDKTAGKNKETLKAKSSKWMAAAVEPIVKKLASSVAPDMRVAENLAQNKGQKAIFFFQDDATVPRHHVEQNVRAVAEAGELENLTLFSAEGMHGQSWLSVKGSPFDYSSIAEKIEKVDKEIDDQYTHAITDAANTRNKQLDELEPFKKLADKMELEGLAPQSIIKGWPEFTANEIRLYVAQREEELQAEFVRLRTEASNIQKERRNEIEQMRASVSPQDLSVTYVARNQIDRFLEKANLSADIIPSKFALRKELYSELANAKWISEGLTVLSFLSALEQGDFTELTVDEQNHVHFNGIAHNGQPIELIINGTYISRFLKANDELAPLLQATEEAVNKFHVSKSSSLDQLRELEPVFDRITHTLESLYSVYNSKKAVEWMDQVVELNSAKDKAKFNLLRPLIELDSVRDAKNAKPNFPELEQRAQQEIEQLQKLKVRAESMANHIKESLAERNKGFPEPVKAVLEEGLLAVTRDLAQLQFYAESQLNETREEWEKTQTWASSVVGLVQKFGFW